MPRLMSVTMRNTAGARSWLLCEFEKNRWQNKFPVWNEQSLWPTVAKDDAEHPCKEWNARNIWSTMLNDKWTKMEADGKQAKKKTENTLWCWWKWWPKQNTPHIFTAQTRPILNGTQTVKWCSFKLISNLLCLFAVLSSNWGFIVCQRKSSRRIQKFECWFRMANNDACARRRQFAPLKSTTNLKAISKYSHQLEINNHFARFESTTIIEWNGCTEFNVLAPRNQHDYFAGGTSLLISRFLELLFRCVFVEQFFFFFHIWCFGFCSFIFRDTNRERDEKKKCERFVCDLCAEFIFQFFCFVFAAAYFHRTIITWCSINNIHMCMHSDTKITLVNGIVTVIGQHNAHCSHNPKLLFQNSRTDSRSLPLWIHRHKRESFALCFSFRFHFFFCVCCHCEMKTIKSSESFSRHTTKRSSEFRVCFFFRIKTKTLQFFSSIFRWIFWPCVNSIEATDQFLLLLLLVAFEFPGEWKGIEIKRKRKIC